MKFKILSLDGGGMRGVLSATILTKVEEILKTEKGLALHEYFDLVAGTSTGSILAAGVALKKKASYMIEIYKDYGDEIFPKAIRNKRHWVGFKQLGIFLYPHEYGDKGQKGLTNVLKNKLTLKQEDGSEKCPVISAIDKPILVVFAYDTLSRNTTFFVSNNPPERSRWYDNIELWEICTASSSAPTFFPPYALPYYGGPQRLPHIDGGVSANNPALAAIAHAFLSSKNNLIEHTIENLSDIAVLSVGTGGTTKPFRYEDVEKLRNLGWAQNIPDMFLNPGSQITEAVCQQLMVSGGSNENYLRLNFDLNERFGGERKQGKLRSLLEKSEIYNRYIKEKTGEKQEISEDIDDPGRCQELIDAAKAYLECGTVAFGAQNDLEVESAIKQFIRAN